MKTILKPLSFIIIFAFSVVFAKSASAQNNALTFDGTGDYISIPDNTAWNFGTRDFTISFWMTLANLNKVHDGLFGRNDFQWLAMEYNHDGDKRLNLWIDSNGSSGWEFNNLKPGKNNWVANSWYHIAVTRKNNVIRIFIDGVESASSSYSSVVYNPSGVPVFFGRSQLAGRNHQGLLDDIRIWNFGLSEEEIKASMNMQLSGNEPGLIGYWNCNQSSGATAFDTSPTMMNATLSGDAVFVNSTCPVNQSPSNSPFTPVEPSGLPYQIIVSDITVDGKPLPASSQVAVYDGSLCVGASVFNSEDNLQITAWKKDASQGLQGFTDGNTISFKIRFTWFSEVRIFNATATFSQGNGTYGNGNYSVAALSLNTGLTPDVGISTSYINFNAISIDSTSKKYLVVTNSGNVPLIISSIAANDADFIVSPSSLTQVAGKSDTVWVTFNPNSVKDYSNKLTFLSNDPDEASVSADLFATSLPSGTPDILVSPAFMDFGGIQKNKSCTLDLNILNKGNSVLSITNITCSNSVFSIPGTKIFSLNQNENKDIPVVFAPVSKGVYSGTITVTSNDGSVAVSVYGIASDNHFSSIANTGLPYQIIIDSVDIDGAGLSLGDEVAVFDGALCTGLAVVKSDDKALLVNTSPDYMSVPDVTLPSAYTLEAWGKFPLPSTPGGWRTLFHYGSGHHHILVSSAGELGTYLNGFYSSGFNVTTLSAGWHFISAVCKDNQTAFYIDGVYVGTVGVKETLSVRYLGNSYGGTQNFGTADEFRVWNYARTPADIQKDMHLMLSGNEPGLIGYWNFYDGTAKDRTSYARNGTLYSNAQIIPNGAVVNNIQLTAWEKDAANSLPGFTKGNAMSYKLWTTVSEQDKELTPVASYITGDGTFGYGTYSVANLKATVSLNPNISVSTTHLYMGQLQVNQSVKDTITIYNKGNATLNVNLNETSSSFSLSKINVNIAAGDSTKVAVTFTPVTAGNNTCNMEVLSNDPDSPSIIVLLEGFALPLGVTDIDVSINNLFFGGAVIGTPVTKSFNIINIGTTPLVISNITSNNNQFTITPTAFTLQNTNDNMEIKVTFNPTAKGEINGTLTVTSNATARYVALTGIGYDGHFTSADNTGSPYNIVMQNSNIVDILTVGDEIAVFDGSQCVGTSPVLPNGNSLYLDGSGDFVTLSANADYTLGTGDFTIELWAYLQSGVNYQHFFAMSDQNTFGFKAQSSTKNIYFYSSAFSTSGTITANYSENEWTHIALVRKNNIAYIYMNGVLAGAKGGFNNNILSNVIYIGNGWTNEYTKGYLDDLRCWNVARSVSDLKDNMFKELTGKENGLIGYWKFNGSALDYSSTKNNGVLNGNASTEGPQYHRLNPVVQVVAWQADPAQGLPGFTKGNTMSFKVWTKINNLVSEFDANPSYIIGDGTFGYGQYSVVNLDFHLPDIHVAPDSFFVALDEPDSTEKIMTISNTGQEELNYEISKYYYSDEPSGYSGSFDGSGDYIDVGNWNAGTKWTIEAWVKPSSAPSGRKSIFGGFGSCADWGLSWNSGYFSTAIKPVTGCNDAVYSSETYQPGKWYYVVGTCDGATAKIYVNGELKGSKAVYSNYNPYSVNRIGGEACCPGNEFPGLIDELRIWNYALSDQQIRENMYKTFLGSENGLMAYYNFNGQNAADLTGKGHNGTFYGNTVTVNKNAPITDWLKLSSLKDTMQASLHDNITLKFVSKGLIDGLYHAELSIKNNTLTNSPVIIPVYLNVTGAAQISAYPASLSFGDILVGKGDTLPYSIENIGTKTLNVDTIYIKNGNANKYKLIGLPLFPFQINPLNKNTYSVSFIPTSDGVRNDTILIVSDASNDDSVKLILSGKGITPPDIAVRPGSWQKTLTSGTIETDTIYIVNEGQANLTFTANENISWLSVNPSSGMISVNDSAAIIMSISAIGVYAGIHTGTLNIVSNDADEPSVPFTLKLTVTGQPKIFAGSSVNFGNVFIGNSLTLKLPVFNSGSDTLTIDSLKISNPVFTMQHNLQKILPGKSDTVSITFSPLTADSYSGILSVFSDAVNINPFDIVLSGKGQQPQEIIVSPASFNITLASGATDNRTLDISNIGGLNLNYTINLAVQGKNALSLDGNGDYINVLNAPAINPDTAFTVEAWIFLKDKTNEYIVAKEYSSIGSYRFYINGSGKYQFTLNGNKSVTSSTTAKTGEWIHAAASFDGKTMKIFINGVEDAIFSNPEFTIISNTSNLRIGRSYANEYFNGYIDELRMWSVAKNATEIMAMKNQSLKGNEKGLALYYRFDEQSGNIAVDASSNHLNGTFYGDATRFTSSIKINDFITLSKTSGTVATGTSDNIPVTFNAGGLQVNQYNHTITVLSNDFDEPETIVPVTLNVTGIPAIKATPGSLGFADTFFGFTDTLNLTISNTGADLLTFSSCTISHSDFSLSEKYSEIMPFSSKNIEVYFTPKTAGQISGTFTIGSNDPVTPTLVIPLSGKGVEPPEITLSASSLDFSAVILPGMEDSTLYIKNTGVSPLQVSKIISSNVTVFSFVKTVPFSLNAGDSTGIVITYSPKAYISYNEILTITTNIGDTIVPLKGSGIKPGDDIGISALISPVTGCGLSATPVTVRIYNYGSVTQTGFNVAYLVNGKPVVTENVGPLTVNPGKSIDYTFTSPVTISANGIYQFTTYTFLTNDQTLNNDTLKKSIYNYPVLEMTVSGDVTTCNGTPVTLIAAAQSSTFKWSNGLNNSWIEVIPSSNTTYTVTATNNNGCKDTDTISVTVLQLPKAPVITAKGQTAICVYDSVLLVSDSIKNIVWNTGSTNDSIYAHTAGLYTVSYTDANGCKSTSVPVTVLVEATPTITTDGAITICVGDDVELTVQNASAYLWSTGETTKKITVAPAITKTYFVTITTPLVCVFHDSLKVTVIPPVSPGAVSNMLPANGILSVSPPVSFSWSPASNASHYDLYIWVDTLNPPSSPTVANLTQINYTYYGALNYGTTYKWKIVSKNSCFQTSSVVQTFSLRYLPDLVINQVQTPSTIYSGQPLTVTWVTKNTGQGSTNSAQWEDGVYLSLDTVINTGDDILIGYKSNVSFLASGQSYSETEAFTIPETLIGNYYVLVKADRTNNLIESDESNNVTFDPSAAVLTIVLPPRPDLIGVSVGIPTAVFSGNTMKVNYSVKNNGHANATGNYLYNWNFNGVNYTEHYWKDAIYISPDSIFNVNTAVKLSDVFIGLRSSLNPEIAQWYNTPDYLKKDSAYSRVVNVTIPHNYFGKYFIFVFTDIYNDVTELVEVNNLQISNRLDVTLTPPCDLVVNDIITPVNAGSSTSISITWKVKNEGAKAPVEKSWNDKVYISTVDTFNSTKCTYIGNTYNYNGNLFEPDSTYTRTIGFTLPNGITGQYYIYVHTDADKNVFEYTYDNNNISRSALPVNVFLSNYPDLVVSDIQLPDTIYADSSVQITWSVKNKGLSTAMASWTDRIFVSSDSSWNPSLAQKLASVNHTANLDTGKTYTETTGIVIPSNISGKKYILVYTDINNNVYEYTFENNNVTNYASFAPPDTSGGGGNGNIDIKPDPTYSDLSVIAFTAPATGNSGKTLSVSWIVKNIYNDTTANSYWYDYLFLSADTNLDQNDVTLDYKVHNGLLAPQENYTVSRTPALPNGISGNYYLLLFSDYYNNNKDDTIRINNRKKTALSVVLTPPPDLVVDTFVVPDQLLAGQNINVSFTVKNQGMGETPENTWYERFYLSNSPDLSASNYYLGSYKRSGALASGSSYNGQIDLTIPGYLSGNYYFIVVADYNNNVYEHTNENNNRKNTVVLINIPDPSDLVISDIIVPVNAYLGDEVSVDYTLKNIGANPATGNIRDALYFSADTAFDGVKDKLLSTNNRYITINPGDSIKGTITNKVPGVFPGDYLGIGRTNILNNIVETNIDNNTTVSSDSMEVMIKELFLDVPEVTPLDKGDVLYYKIVVPADQDLLITLTSNQANGSNEVYAAYEKIPTANYFDYLYDTPQNVNQKVLIPTTKAGTYYLMIKTSSDFNGLQQVTILAKALPFSIISITPDTVGQGIVTCKVKGARFAPTTRFFLLEKDSAVLAEAKMKIYYNSMSVDLLWNFTNTDTGTYDVLALNTDNKYVRLSDGMTIEPSTGFLLDYSYISPNLLRVGHNGSYAFYFQNTGNVDIPFVKGDFTMPVKTTIVNMLTSGNVYKRSEFITDTTLGKQEDWFDYDNYRHLPVLGKDMAPGDLFSVSLIVKDFYSSIFPVRIRGKALGTADFIQMQLAYSEGLRQEMLNDPAAFGVSQYTDVLNTLGNHVAWRDSILEGYFDLGFLYPDDTIGVDLNCDICINGYTGGSSNGGYTGNFTFSPGMSPGVEEHSNVTFGEGDDYLWEINKYNGASGKDPGCDLVKTGGTLEVTSTPGNPFVVRVASLTYENVPGSLGGWYPAGDKCWAIAIAEGGVIGFDPDKFAIDVTRFTNNNNLYGGTFTVDLSGSDTILLCFHAYTPAVGEEGVPGAPGAPGEDGTPGGQGGPGNGVLPPGNGGTGGQGGSGTATLPPGNGGPGGPGGNGGSGQNGGNGGQGGQGGTGAPGGVGGSGGSGGTGGTGGSGGNGGNGGNGGTGGTGGSGSGPGGTGGSPGNPGNGPAGPGQPGSSGTPGSPGSSTPGGNPGGDTGTSGGKIPCSSNNMGQAFCDNFFRVAGCANTIYTCASGIATYAGAGAVVGAAWGAIAGAVWGGISCGISIYNCATGGNDISNAIGCIGIIDGALCIGQYICNQVVKSCDPNDIIGPPGYGDPKFVSVNDILAYTIRYENDSAFATTAAQRVVIREKLDNNVNPLSFRLKDFGFYKYIFEVPKNMSSLFATIYFYDTKGEPVPESDIFVEQEEGTKQAIYAVEVTAGIDVQKNEAFWIFQTIDPGTGLPPTDPTLGYLAINDEMGRGEGFVNYTVKSKSTSKTGDTLFAEAEIVFDINDPILTPKIYNVIDAYPPNSFVDALPPVSDTTTFPVTILGADDAGGSGINLYRLYVSENMGNYKLFGEYKAPVNTIQFTGKENMLYHFFSTSVDNVNNTQSMKTGSDTYTQINTSSTDSITGKVSYDNTAHTAMKDVKIYLRTLQGAILDSSVTDAAGMYLFNKVGKGSYVVNATSSKTWGGVNATDALLVNRHAIGSLTLTPFRQLAADVNSSKTINATDALLIKRRSIASINSFPAGDWVFETDTLNINGENVSFNINGLCMGDVNGSYTPPKNLSSSNVILINKDQMIAGAYETFFVDIKSTGNMDLGAITLDLLYPADLVSVTDIRTKANDLLFHASNGHLRIAWDDLTGLEFYENETFLTLVLQSLVDKDTSFTISLGENNELANPKAVPLKKAVFTVPFILCKSLITDIKPLDIPAEYFLLQNTPNPFSKNTQIQYGIPEQGKVMLTIFNIIGEPVRVIVYQMQDAGTYTVEFSSAGLEPGFYLYKLEVSGEKEHYLKTLTMTIH